VRAELAQMSLRVGVLQQQLAQRALRQQASMREAEGGALGGLR
jgi:hypothetical protein